MTMQDDIKLPDPDDAVAHMFPSDLAKFKKTERVRYAYPVPVSSPKERSIPLYTADQVRAAVLADREGRQQWISVEDRLPNTDEIVLVLVPGARYQQVALDCWRMQREAPLSWSSATIEIGMGWDDHEFDEVTHWMPLPTPPADAQRAKGE